MAAKGLYLSAVFGIFCFPPFSFWPLALVALVPFLMSAVELPPRTAFRHGYIAGFLFFAGLLYWLGFNSGAPPALAWASCVAVIAILATVWAITAWAVARAMPRHGSVWVAVLFVMLFWFFEVFWGTGELGFPWIVWGLTQTTFLPALQFADIGDIYGLSLWVLSCNALAFLLLRGQHMRVVMPVFFLLLLAVPGYGIYRLTHWQSGKTLRVAALQLNTPVDDKWEKSVEESLDEYLLAGSALTDSNVSLLVWPETATPIALRYKQWAREKIQRWTDSTDISLVTGATDYKSDGAQGILPHNSAFYFRANNAPAEPRSSGRRDALLASHKVHLVPFGERIPGQKYLPFLGKIRLGQAEFLPGDSVTVFPKWRDLPEFATLICFEVVFPDVAAEMVKRGAQFLTNVTEDGWYGRSSEQSQHLELTRLRAVATRRSLVRSANLGYPALILPTGVIAQQLPLDQSGAIFGDLPLQDEITVAVRIAHLHLWIAAALLAILILWLNIRIRQFAKTTH